MNDIFYQGKKLCGILCEAISDFESGRLEAIIVGIGLNTSTMTFPEELKDIAVSLSTHPVNRNKLIACIVNELLALQKEEHSSVLAQYRDAFHGFTSTDYLDAEREAAQWLCKGYQQCRKSDSRK